MFKTILASSLVVAGLALSGCATTSDTNLTNAICSHQVAITTTAELALQNAQYISDDAARAAAISAAQAALASVAVCPVH